MRNVLVLAAFTGCLPTYEPAPPNLQAEPGPARTQEQASTEVLQVRPQDPAAEASVYLEAGDVSLLVDRLAEEGPPDQSSRRHSCMKMKFDTVGRLLAGRGVNLTLPVNAVTTTANCNAMGLPVNAPNRAITQPARFVYCDSRGPLGLPQYAARLPEAPTQTTASATKMHDLFLASAADVVDNLDANGRLGKLRAVPSCTYQGQPARLFDAQNQCDPIGVACLIGYVPEPDVLTLCNQVVQSAQPTPAGTGSTAVDKIPTGKRLAVATLLAAAHMCE